MTTILSEGVIVPDVGDVNWAGKLEVNWNLLNGALANLSGNVKLDRDNTWTGEQSFTLPIVGSITGTASKAIADEDGTSIKTGYVNVAGNQTVSGQKTWTGSNTFTSTITTKTNVDRAVAPTSDTTYGTIICRDKNGSAMFRMQGTIKTDLSNVWDMMMVAPNNSYITFFRYSINTATSDRELRFKADSVIPDDSSTSKLGTSTNQWSSVYAQTYYYNGTAWGLDKANTWTESQAIKNTGYQIGEIPSAAKARYINFTDKNNVNIGWIQRRIESNGDSSIELFVYNRFTNSQPDTAGTQDYAMLKVGLKSDQTHFCEITGDTYPRNSNTYNLGTSTNKWKSLNGVNPGALSLPSNSYIDISGDVTVRDGSAANELTASCDGWISINSFATRIQISDDTTTMATNGKPGDDGFAQVFLPVRQGDSIRIVINQTNTQFQSFRLIPCLGNV